MTEIQFVGTLGELEDADEPWGEIFTMALDSPRDWPASLNLPSRYFKLMLAGDPSAIPDDELLPLASSALHQGAVWISAWGEDCERVHDLFDKILVELRPAETEADVVLTVWDWDDSLDRALRSFLFAGRVADDYQAECGSLLVCSLGDPQLHESIRVRLKDPWEFNERVLGDGESEE